MPAQFGSDKWWTRNARHFATAVEVLGFLCTVYLILLSQKQLAHIAPIKFGNDHWLVATVVGIVAISPRLVRHILSEVPRHWPWQAIRVLLNQVAEDVFPELKIGTKVKGGNRADEVTVTVFRYEKGWFGQEHVIGRERHGRHFRGSGCRWRAPLSHPSRAEGIAGQVFVGGREIEVESLPNLENVKTEEAIARYAKKTFMSEGRLRRSIKKHKGRLPTYYYGAPVVGTIDGREGVWGCIVICSRVKPTQDVRRAVESISALLTEFTRLV